MSSRVQQFKQGLAPTSRSSSRVQDFKQQLGYKQSSPIFLPKPTKTNLVTQGAVSGLKQAGQSAVGSGKGILSTLNNVSKIGQKALGGLTGGIIGMFGGSKPAVASLPEKLTTPTEAQKPAFVGEQIGEFFTPSGVTSKATKALDIAADGAKLGKVGAIGVKALGRAAIEGTAAGTVRYGQTANAQQGLKAGATAGVLAGGTSLVGSVLKTARIPEWFYSKIYRTTADDMMQELKTVGTANLQKTNPDLYKNLVSSGVIKVDSTGKTILNETLAKEALDRGLKGSIKNMANEVVKNTYQMESQAQKLTATHNRPIKIEPQYTKLLKEVADDYQDVGFGEISQKANDLLRKTQTGSTDASTALELRRFLDGMRARASFNPVTKLTQTQVNFKTLADTLRQRLAKEVPNLESVMNEYRFNIEALDALAKEAAKRGNREVIGLIDTVFLGSGIATNNPIIGGGLSIGRRLLNSPTGTTRVGTALNNIGTGTKAGALVRGSAAYFNSKESPSIPDSR
jgi:hypothetical protein